MTGGFCTEGALNGSCPSPPVGGAAGYEASRSVEESTCRGARPRLLPLLSVGLREDFSSFSSSSCSDGSLYMQTVGGDRQVSAQVGGARPFWATPHGAWSRGTAANQLESGRVWSESDIRPGATSTAASTRSSDRAVFRSKRALKATPVEL